MTRGQRVFGATGALLFAASLGYFLFTYAITFGEITPGPVDPRAVLADVALFTIFAVHHSLFARERLRRWVRGVAGLHGERPVYVWVASLMLVGVCALWQPVAGVAWQVPAPARWALLAVQAFGVWLSVRSAALLDVRDLSGLRPPAGTQPGEFRTVGPYGYVRHPIYAGWFLIVFAAPTMTSTRLVFAVVSCAYLLVGIHLEERTLRESPGGRYADYVRKVPYRLLPGVY